VSTRCPSGSSLQRHDDEEEKKKQTERDLGVDYQEEKIKRREGIIPA
jgi:hypothetical protein